MGSGCPNYVCTEPCVSPFLSQQWVLQGQQDTSFWNNAQLSGL